MGLNSKFWWKWLLVGGTFCFSLTNIPALAQETGFINLYNTGVDIRLGARYFERQCSRCHGLDAKGNDETGAPDLTVRLSRASSDAGVFRIIREGIAGTAMLPVSADVPDPQVWQLVTYIASLSTDPANFDLPGSVAAGAALFTGRGDCGSCHMVGGVGGRQGPDLSRVGERRDPDELKTDLIDPNETVLPRWWTIRATATDGTVVEGWRMGEDTFGIRLIDADANLWSFSKEQMQSYERVEDSTMPSYAQTFSESEIDDLVAYLFSLRKEN